MKEKNFDTSLLDKAIKLAVDAHSGIERRKKGFPYIVHPMEAVSIAATLSSDQEILAAAALHDVIEDTEYTEEDIEREFGKRVAELVKSESDIEIPGLSESESWIIRKQHVIDRLAKQGFDEKIVAMGDKLSNMRAIASDYEKLGDKLWQRFHVTDPKLHEWHYRGLLSSFTGLEDTAAYKEFEYLINKTFNK